jgi:hypothetical protein
MAAVGGARCSRPGKEREPSRQNNVKACVDLRMLAKNALHPIEKKLREERHEKEITTSNLVQMLIQGATDSANLVRRLARAARGLTFRRARCTRAGRHGIDSCTTTFSCVYIYIITTRQSRSSSFYFCMRMPRQRSCSAMIVFLAASGRSASSLSICAVTPPWAASRASSVALAVRKGTGRRRLRGRGVGAP